MLLTLFLKFQLECTDASFSALIALDDEDFSLWVYFIFINSNEFKPLMKIIYVLIGPCKSMFNVEINVSILSR
jgi:hypothetical protein